MRAAANRRRKQAENRRRKRGLFGGFKTSMDDGTTKLQPMDNVYSYFMFMAPIERKKNPTQLSWNMMFAWLLVILNFCLQGTVLYAVFTAVVSEEVVWRNSIISLQGQSVNPLAPPPAECNPGGSLCMENNGTFTCAPPSVQLAGRWDMLDLNSDGIWTKEEVLEVQDDLKCQFAVDPLEVFNVFVNFLKKREDVLWLHPLVRTGKALHKHYFDFAKGDIIMCTYRNQDMCPNLLKRGFFDAPLMSGASPRVGKTIESALNYCYDLLKHGGVCERSLPSAYSVWRKDSEQQCFDQVYDPFVYKHPKTGKAKSLLAVNYEAVSDYEKGRRSILFMTYKSIIIFTFVLVMVVELKDTLIMFTWVLTFPSEVDVDEAVEEVHDAEGKVEKYVVQGITFRHRMLMGVITLARFTLALVLVWVGVVFLLNDTDYVNLLLNGVGLVFIIEIANCLYGQTLDSELREQCENTDPILVPMASVWKVLWFPNPAVRDLIKLACILTLLFGGMYLHYIHIAKPLSTALECTCLSQGDHCFEASAFNKDFWKTYWDHDVPEIFASVKKLKMQAADDKDVSGAFKMDASGSNFIGTGVPELHDSHHRFATLKVHPYDVDVAQKPHERQHRVTRLLNGHGRRRSVLVT